MAEKGSGKEVGGSASGITVTRRCKNKNAAMPSEAGGSHTASTRRPLEPPVGKRKEGVTTVVTPKEGTPAVTPRAQRLSGLPGAKASRYRTK